MRIALGLTILLSVVSFEASARADSYSWSGRSGRFEASVALSGFNEGAGVGGWDEDGARSFAAWAKRFNAAIPPGARVIVSREAFDEDTTVLFELPNRTDSVVLPGGPDLEATLPVVADYFGVAVPAPLRKPVGLFTLQLFASRSPTFAERFSALVEEQGLEAEGSFYDEACHPCRIPPTRTLEKNGIHRVIAGVFDSYEDAARSLATLEKTYGRSGFVRVL